MTAAKVERDSRKSPEDLARKVLDAPMGENDADARTVREYLLRLLADVWTYEEEFNGKRPFGNSSWKYEVYDALAAAGIVRLARDADGAWEWSQDDGAKLRKADNMVRKAIRHLAAPPPATAGR